MLRKNTDQLKTSLNAVRVKKELAQDLIALKSRFNEVTKSGNYTAEEVKKISRELGAMTTKARDAGINVGKLHQELRALNMQSFTGNMSLRSQTLIEKGAAMRADARGQVIDAAAAGYAILKPLNIAADFEDMVKDIAITGGLNRQQEAELSNEIRNLSLKYNQSQEATGEMTKRLVESGMSVAQARALTPLLAKTATATRTDSGDAALMARSFDLLGVKDMTLAFNQAALGGKAGSFELANMARWFPQLGGFMKALGVTGNEAVVSMASRLQIATRTAGGNDEAANNFKNYLTKITSGDTITDFHKQGIDLVGRLKASAAQGTDPISASVGIVLDHLKTKAPAAAAELNKMVKEVASIKDPAARAEELQRRSAMITSIGERAGLGELFQDMQAVQYLMSEIQNQSDLKKIMNEVRTGKNKSGKTAIDEDFASRTAGMKEQFKGLKIAVTDLVIAIGNALAPAAKFLTPIIKGLAATITGFTQAHPTATTFFATLLAGGAIFKVMAFGVKWLGGGILSLAGSFIKVVQVIGLVGRVLLLNPLGLLITGIAVAALLIYKYWEPMRVFFSKLWSGVKSSFNSAWEWIKSVHAKFVGFGAMLIEGLVGGITSKLSAAKEAIIGFGKNIKGWFADTLGIKSPSRVFIGFGNHIGDGASLGIQQRVGAVAHAAKKLAGAAIAGAAIAASPSYAAGAHGAASVIHFSPTIHISGASGDVRGQVNAAMAMSFAEFEKMMKKYEAGKKRVAF